MRHDLINRGEPWLYRGQNRECVTGALEAKGIKFPFKRKACHVYKGGCCRQVSIVVSRTFSKKDHFFGQKISKILCLVFDFICIYYMSSDY